MGPRRPIPGRPRRALGRAAPRFGDIDLLCGNALGGALAQALLGELPPTTAALLVSGPARTDGVLDARLARIAEMAEAGRVGEALRLLSLRILPEGALPPRLPAEAPPPPAEAGPRLAGGLRLLCGSNVSASVLRHPGPLLNIVGGRSQLVGHQHTAAAAHHEIRTVPGCGMRPQSERPGEVSRIIQAFLREKRIL
ncbi:hypothetical protein GXW82_06740 [Streptacidiphilus sp. 4-A2]|nr:hypothetical protein [Streptacidiphilus sp. 4-A2]